MENMDKKQWGDMESKDSCGCGMHHGGKHHLIKIILKLVIVIIIFWCGFQLGQMTGFIKASENGIMHTRTYSNNMAPNINAGATTLPPAQ